MSNKTSWPELVGKPVDEAVATIKKENSSLDVMKVKHGSPVTADYRTDRVRVYFNPAGMVSSAPTVG